jgi:hypothetical protein
MPENIIEPEPAIEPIEPEIVFDYVISRYERTGDKLFMRIDATNKPVYIEHWFTAEEQASNETLQDAITKLVAILSVSWDNYVAPAPVVDCRAELSGINISLQAVEIMKAELNIIYEEN